MYKYDMKNIFVDIKRLYNWMLCINSNNRNKIKFI